MRTLAPAFLIVAGIIGTAHADDGERLFQQCYACHSVIPDETDLPGPNLSGIVDAPVAADAKFPYSDALAEFAASEPVWTAELLDRFLADPEALIAGTDMAYTGLKDAEDRQTLIDWLAGQPDS